MLSIYCESKRCNNFIATSHLRESNNCSCFSTSIIKINSPFNIWAWLLAIRSACIAHSIFNFNIFFSLSDLYNISNIILFIILLFELLHIHAIRLLWVFILKCILICSNYALKFLERLFWTWLRRHLQVSIFFTYYFSFLFHRNGWISIFKRIWRINLCDTCLIVFYIKMLLRFFFFNKCLNKSLFFYIIMLRTRITNFSFMI